MPCLSAPVELRLMRIELDGSREELAFDWLPLFVGRAPSADIYVDSAYLSRIHCRLDCISGHLEIRDLCSTNGTVVNGANIDVARLRAKDRIVLADTAFVVLSFQAQVIDQNLAASGRRQHKSRLVSTCGSVCGEERKVLSASEFRQQD
jgi:hypothetical protein